ncbi:MAG: preprotein translocase subunit YajC [Fibrobacter sp.]|nr:preprotein translocase subunit YajC [Fibrobacter sp.]
MRFSNIIATVVSLALSAAPVLAQDAPAQQPPGGGFGSILPMMILMFVIIYFLMIRPEQKKQKQRLEMLKNIKKGDKILTASGMIGTVGNIKDNTVMVKIAENTVVEFTKSAITTVITDEKAVEKAEEKKK